MSKYVVKEEFKSYANIDSINLINTDEHLLEQILYSAEEYVIGAVDDLEEKCRSSNAYKNKVKLTIMMIAQGLWDSRSYLTDKNYKPSYMANAFLLQLQTTSIESLRGKR